MVDQPRRMPGSTQVVKQLVMLCVPWLAHEEELPNLVTDGEPACIRLGKREAFGPVLLNNHTVVGHNDSPVRIRV